MQAELTFELVNEQLNKADLIQFKTGGSKHIAAAEVKSSPCNVLQTVCSANQFVKPILRWILPILPAKWKEM